MDRIAYTQILTRAGFIVRELTGVRSSGRPGQAQWVDPSSLRELSKIVRCAIGVFERDAATVEFVEIEISGDDLVIAKQPHSVTVRPDGTFDLFTAHAD